MQVVIVFCTHMQAQRRVFILISQVITGSKREIEDHIIPRSADADDDAEIKSDDDERLVTINLFVVILLAETCLCSHFNDMFSWYIVLSLQNFYLIRLLPVT